jgi:hypothetical protein
MKLIDAAKARERSSGAKGLLVRDIETLNGEIEEACSWGRHSVVFYPVSLIYEDLELHLKKSKYKFRKGHTIMHGTYYEINWRK